jgi:lipid II:glycine glycyltransferase (peptidoglycan interpeptide bridge formation enzyme)
VVDLQGTEDQILARMKQKTRYNIRLARRKGVVIRQTGDVETFYQLMEITAERDAFGVHNRTYYQQAFDLFEPRGQCALLIAEFEEQPLAGLMVFTRGKRAWYFYGASSNEQRQLMPTYLLQWIAMQWAKAQGCLEYDLWGVPDAELEELETGFMERDDGLWGVYRFKRGFGGDLRRSAPTWDRVYNPLFYKFYLWRMGSGSANLL